MMFDDNYGDGVEPQFKAVEQYYFEVTEDERVCFSILPYQFDENDEVADCDSGEKVYLRGHVFMNKSYPVHKKVVAWRIALDCEKPKISVLSSEGNWIELLNPWKPYQDEIARSIFITVQMLHFVRKHHGDKRRLWGDIWDHLNEVFNKLDTKPAMDDLRKHNPLIKLFLEKDPGFMKLKILHRFIRDTTKTTKKPRIMGNQVQLTDSDYDDDDEENNDFDDDDKNDSDYNYSNDIENNDFDDDDYNGSDYDDSIDIYSEDDNSDGDTNYDDGTDTLCALCDDGGNLLSCIGQCKRSFHPRKVDGKETECKTLGYTSAQLKEIDSYLCKNCEYKQHQCFKCGELESSAEPNAKVFKCKSPSCGHFYHPKCVANLLEPDDPDGDGSCELARRIMEGLPFTCPVHWCSKCRRMEDKTQRAMQLAACRRCPKSYHIECLPREISFKTKDENIKQRAWKLSGIVIIYCLEHEICEATGSAKRGHIKFPQTTKIIAVRGLAEKNGNMANKRKRSIGQCSANKNQRSSLPSAVGSKMEKRDHEICKATRSAKTDHIKFPQTTKTIEIRDQKGKMDSKRKRSIDQCSMKSAKVLNRLPREKIKHAQNLSEHMVLEPECSSMNLREYLQTEPSMVGGDSLSGEKALEEQKKPSGSSLPSAAGSKIEMRSIFSSTMGCDDNSHMLGWSSRKPPLESSCCNSEDKGGSSKSSQYELELNTEQHNKHNSRCRVNIKSSASRSSKLPLTKKQHNDIGGHSSVNVDRLSGEALEKNVHGKKVTVDDNHDEHTIKRSLELLNLFDTKGRVSTATPQSSSGHSGGISIVPTQPLAPLMDHGPLHVLGVNKKVKSVLPIETWEEASLASLNGVTPYVLEEDPNAFMQANRHREAPFVGNGMLPSLGQVQAPALSLLLAPASVAPSTICSSPAIASLAPLSQAQVVLAPPSTTPAFNAIPMPPVSAPLISDVISLSTRGQTSLTMHKKENEPLMLESSRSTKDDEDHIPLIELLAKKVRSRCLLEQAKEVEQKAKLFISSLDRHGPISVVGSTPCLDGMALDPPILDLPMMPPPEHHTLHVYQELQDGLLKETPFDKNKVICHIKEVTPSRIDDYKAPRLTSLEGESSNTKETIMDLSQEETRSYFEARSYIEALNLACLEPNSDLKSGQDGRATVEAWHQNLLCQRQTAANRAAKHDRLATAAWSREAKLWEQEDEASRLLTEAQHQNLVLQRHCATKKAIEHDMLAAVARKREAELREQAYEASRLLAVYDGFIDS